MLEMNSVRRGGRKATDRAMQHVCNLMPFTYSDVNESFADKKKKPGRVWGVCEPRGLGDPANSAENISWKIFPRKGWKMISGKEAWISVRDQC